MVRNTWLWAASRASSFIFTHLQEDKNARSKKEAGYATPPLDPFVYGITMILYIKTFCTLIFNTNVIIFLDREVVLHYDGGT